MQKPAMPDIDEFLSRLRQFVARRVRNRDDADDIVQMTIARLLAAKDQPDASTTQRWLYVAARNAIIDHYRKGRVEPIPDDLPAEIPEDAGVLTELSRCIPPMLRALDDADQKLLTSVDIEGASQASLARDQGVAASVIKSRVQRARKRLRAQLEACCSIAIDRRRTPTDFTPRTEPSSSCSGDCS